MIQINPNRKIENDFPDSSEKTATNSFTTLDGGLVSALNVAFTPIQDLHGYSKPWPGGAGKNKLPNNGISTYTAGSLTFTKQDDGSVLVNGTNNTGNTVNYFFNVENTQGGTPCFATLPEGTYTLTGCPTGGGPGSWSYALQLYYGGNTSNTYGDSFDTRFDFGEGMTVVANSGNNSNVGCRICVADGKTINNLVFKPMLRLASIADPTFEPYSNICPISGHTQVQSKINNTTYTTSLGGTYYGGDVEQVGGTGEQIYDIVDLGDLNWSYESSWGAGADFYTSGLASLAKLPLTDDDKGNIICTQYENKSRNDFYNSAESAVTLLRGGVLKVRDSRYSDTATFKTAMAGVKLVYELATPTALTLTGQNITADVGENNVSAPLENQEIVEDGVTYKEMFSWADVVAYVQSQVNP